jgi:hypothetical protein
MTDQVIPTERLEIYLNSRRLIVGLLVGAFFSLAILLVGVVFSLYMFNTHTNIMTLAAPPLPRMSPDRTVFACILLFYLVDALVIAGYYLVMWRYYRRKNPVVILSKEGIEIDFLAAHIGLIYWNEISEVRAYSVIHQYVGIVPNDLNTLVRRLGGKHSRQIRLNEAFARLQRRFGMFGAPINLPAGYLSTSADQLLEAINTYRATSNDSAAFLNSPTIAISDAWPPAPTQPVE